MPQALFVERLADDHAASLRSLPTDALPAGDVDVEVLYSSLNYKDALAVTGRGHIIRGALPFVPGIDLVGRVVDSRSPEYSQGDLVIQTGWGLGESYWGGYATHQRLQSKHLVRLPARLSPLEAMVIGTAGFTAMLAVRALEAYVPPGGDVVVTGASGGVGSMAVALSKKLGFHVFASTGSTAAHDYLRALGADEILPRSDLASGAARPLDSARWVGGIDSVGGVTLAALISRLRRHGAVAVCGLAGGADLHTTVFPFILRGVSMLGIDSNTCPAPDRNEAWSQVAEALSSEMLKHMTRGVVPLASVPEFAAELLAGGVIGRVVVDCQT